MNSHCVYPSDSPRGFLLINILQEKCHLPISTVFIIKKQTTQYTMDIIQLTQNLLFIRTPEGGLMVDTTKQTIKAINAECYQIAASLKELFFELRQVG